jgi:hypothetical protein
MYVCRYTSVLPAEAQEISLEQAHKHPGWRHGAVLECIMSEIHGGRGDRITAGAQQQPLLLCQQAAGSRQQAAGRHLCRQLQRCSPASPAARRLPACMPSCLPKSAALLPLVPLHRVAGVGRMVVSAKRDGKATEVMGGLATEYKGHGDIELAQQQLDEALEGGWRGGRAGGLWISCFCLCACPSEAGCQLRWR